MCLYSTSKAQACYKHVGMEMESVKLLETGGGGGGGQRNL